MVLPTPTPVPTVVLIPSAEWAPSDYVALAAVFASFMTAIFVARWSHTHDLEMRNLDYAQQRTVREEERQAAREKEEAAKHEEWVARIQMICAAVRTELLSDFHVDDLIKKSGDNVLAILKEKFDFNLRGRLSLIYNFAPAGDMRDAANSLTNRLLKYFNRVRAAAGKSSTHPLHDEYLLRAQRAYGEAHYALDELVHLAGGPEPTPRDSYFFALETDP